MIKNMDCVNCGNHLDASKIINGVIRCEYCGSEFTVARSDNEQSLEYLRAADVALGLCKFDDARIAYGKAAEYDVKEPEVYWGMALADFKVQYLIDKREGKRLQPICHEISKKLFSENENYKKALRFASAEQKEQYEARAAEIDYIRNKFYKFEQSGATKYDCFICVKVSEKDDDDNKTGNNKIYTRDSMYARDLYDYLVDAGYTPFYSEREIKNKVGADYEAEILYALHSASCMVVVCGNENYLRTPWVQNEYTRFLQLINKEDKAADSLTVAWFGSPIESLPGRNGVIQGIDLERPDAFGIIEKFVAKNKLAAAPKIMNRKVYSDTEHEKLKAVQTQIVKRDLGKYVKTAITVSEQAKLDIARDMLESRNFEAAISQCDKLLLTNNSCSDAYWIKFLAENKCNSKPEFEKSSVGVHDFNNFEKAIATGSKEQLLEYYGALYNRIFARQELNLYLEYISLPDSTSNAISELTNAMYMKLLSEFRIGRKSIDEFNEIIKTVSNTDTYIKMNLEFADNLFGINDYSDAIIYYKKVLDVDASNEKAMWSAFVIENNFCSDSDSARLAEYVSVEQNRAAAEKKLFSYGFNTYAFDKLFYACLEKISVLPQKLVERFDFLLSLIPNGKDKLYIKCLLDVTDKTLAAKLFDIASYYNDKIIAFEKFNHRAYFCRIYIKNQTINPLFFADNPEALYNDSDFMTAMEIYAEHHKNERNIYSVFVNTLKDMANSSVNNKLRYILTYYDLNQSALSEGAGIAYNNNFTAVAQVAGNPYTCNKELSREFFVANENCNVARLSEIYLKYQKLNDKIDELKLKIKSKQSKSNDIFGQIFGSGDNDLQEYVKELNKVKEVKDQMTELINTIPNLTPEKVAESYQSYLNGKQQVQRIETVKHKNKNRLHAAVLFLPIVPVSLQILFLVTGIENRTWLVTKGFVLWILVTILCVIISLIITAFAVLLINKKGSVLHGKKFGGLAGAFAFLGAILIVPNFLVGFMLGNLKISTPDEFNAITYISKSVQFENIELVTDLDFEGRVLVSLDYKKYYGPNKKLLGNGHTIKNFRVESEYERWGSMADIQGIGLVNNCSVENLRVENGYYTLIGYNPENCGAILGQCSNCNGRRLCSIVISNCSINNCFVCYENGAPYEMFTNISSSKHKNS